MKIESNRSLLRDTVDFLHKNIIAVIVCFVVVSGIIATLFIYMDNDSKKEKQDAVKFKASDTLFFSIRQPKNMNILTSNEVDVYQMWHLLYSGLFYFNKDLSVSPDIVDTYKTDESAGTVSLKLKQNGAFSDGSPIKADDVEFTVDAIKDIGEEGPFFSYGNKIASVEKTGEFDITINFANPGDASLSNLVFPIISSEHFKKDLTGYDQVTSGIYSVSSQTENGFKLSPNKGYFGKKAGNDLVFSFTKQGEDLDGLITIGAVTSKMAKGINAQSDADDLQLDFTPIISNRMEYIGFNFRNEFLKDKTLRRAIIKSINFNSLVDDYFGGLGLPNNSIYFPDFLSVKDTKSVDYSPSKAVVSLENKGYKKIDDNNSLVTKKGEKVTLRLLINDSNSFRKSMAEDIKNYLKKINIDLQIESVPDSEYFSRLGEGNFDIFIGGMEFDPRYDLRKLFDKSGSIGYSNEDVINLADQMEHCISPDKRQKIFRKLSERLTDDVPYYCIGYYEYGLVSGGKWAKKPDPTFFNIYDGCENWKWSRPDSVKDKSNLKEDGEGKKS